MGGFLNQEIKNTIKITTDKGAQYDACAKRILGQKIILAHILVKTVDEFKGMNPQLVTLLIEGAIYQQSSDRFWLYQSGVRKRWVASCWAKYRR